MTQESITANKSDIIALLQCLLDCIPGESVELLSSHMVKTSSGSHSFSCEFRMKAVLLEEPPL